MHDASLTERMSRTVSELTFGFGDLRERLPVAYNDGFGTIGRSEVDVISVDVGVKFGNVHNRLNTIEDRNLCSVAASIAALDDDEIIRLAKEIVGIYELTLAAIELRKAKL